jgi:hypothetical protein
MDGDTIRCNVVIESGAHWRAASWASSCLDSRPLEGHHRDLLLESEPLERAAN